MQVNLPYSIVYTNSGEVPLGIVAKNLLAHEALIKETVKIIDQVYPQVEISVTTVNVRSVTHGSLREYLAVGVFIAVQEDLEKEVPDLIEKITGLDVPDSADTFVTALVMLVVAYLAGAAIDRIFPGSDTKKIKESYERRLEYLTEKQGLDMTAFNSYLEHEYKREQPKSLVSRVVDIIMPAKLDPIANLETPDGEVLFSHDAIGQIPISLGAATTDGRSYPMENVFVEVHRSDRDQNRYGWRAVIPEVSEKKVRLELHSDLDPKDYYGAESLTGDVAVREEPNEEGDMEPRVYYLNRISYEQNEP